MYFGSHYSCLSICIWIWKYLYKWSGKVIDYIHGGEYFLVQWSIFNDLAQKQPFWSSTVEIYFLYHYQNISVLLQLWNIFTISLPKYISIASFWTCGVHEILQHELQMLRLEQYWYILVVLEWIYFQSWCRWSWLNDWLWTYRKPFVPPPDHSKSIILPWSKHRKT